VYVCGHSDLPKPRDRAYVLWLRIRRLGVRVPPSAPKAAPLRLRCAAGIVDEIGKGQAHNRRFDDDHLVPDDHGSCKDLQGD
jgi:hypothetical protein